MALSNQQNWFYDALKDGWYDPVSSNYVVKPAEPEKLVEPVDQTTQRFSVLMDEL